MFQMVNLLKLFHIQLEVICFTTVLFVEPQLKMVLLVLFQASTTRFLLKNVLLQFMHTNLS